MKHLMNIVTMLVWIVLAYLLGWEVLIGLVAFEVGVLVHAHLEKRRIMRAAAVLNEELRFRAAKPVWRSLPWNG